MHTFKEHDISLTHTWKLMLSLQQIGHDLGGFNLPQTCTAHICTDSLAISKPICRQHMLLDCFICIYPFPAPPRRPFSDSQPWVESLGFMGTKSEGHERFCKGRDPSIPSCCLARGGRARNWRRTNVRSAFFCWRTASRGADPGITCVAIVATLFFKCNNLSIPKTCIHLPNKSGKISPAKITNSRKNPNLKKKKHANAGLGSHQLQQRPVF